MSRAFQRCALRRVWLRVQEVSCLRHASWRSPRLRVAITSCVQHWGQRADAQCFKACCDLSDAALNASFRSVSATHVNIDDFSNLLVQRDMSMSSSALDTESNAALRLALESPDQALKLCKRLCCVYCCCRDVVVPHILQPCKMCGTTSSYFQHQLQQCHLQCFRGW